LEALVALAVTSVGMLGILSIQSTLRLNADIARQRTEAVRIAQESIEQWRAFSQIEPVLGTVAYGDIGTQAAQNIAGYTTNTTYALTRTVSEAAAQGFKRLSVAVEWPDRSGQLQVVRLWSIVGAAPPELSGSVTQRPNGNPARQPLGRHAGIPIEARDIGGGQSAFKPPGNHTVAWVFDNRNGFITSVCTVAASVQNVSLVPSDLSACDDSQIGQLLSGSVRFATGATVNAAVAENPSSNALNLDVAIALSSSGHGSPGYECFDDAPATSGAALLTTVVRYFCAVAASTERKWSGRSTVEPRAFTDTGVGWVIAASPDTAFKVCRYTPATSDSQAVANALHPRTYVDVVAPLVRQNFLVVSAANECPTDGPADPAAGDFINSNTLQHQP
jgi:hypothetical protein